MRRNFLILFFFLALWMVCSILGILIGGVITFLIDGSYDYASFPRFMSEASAGDLPSPYLQIFLIFNHLFSFVVPALGITYFMWKEKIFEGLRLTRFPSLPNLALGMLILILVLPLSLYFNEILQDSGWPSWLPAGDDDVMDMMKVLLIDKSIGTLLLNLLLIGVMAAVGEELLFRGFLQQYLEELFQSGHFAVILTAFIFGILHFQADGLIVRIILGVLLGYYFYYSRNLWLSILIHFIYNGIQVFYIYLTPESQMEEILNESGASIGLLPAILIFIPALIAFKYFRKRNYGQKGT